jgi:K+-transporting ATPase ATPase A chain
MTGNDWLQLALFLALLLLLVKPLGGFMARVYQGEPTLTGRLLRPVERGIYRLMGVDEAEEMGWKRYTVALLLFNLLGIVMVYLLQRLQGALPLNPQAMAGVEPQLAWNTAVSFASNTNWQAYGGETTLSYLTQMLGLTVQNFVSAATGMAVLVALARGIIRRETDRLGSFWVDLVRGTLHILLPLSTILALLLVSQGVIQNFEPSREVALVEPIHADSSTIATQLLPMGPAASQVAIKQLGTNGGGFFNTNSAHPFENPTPLSNLLELLSIVLIPASLCYTFGALIKDKRQGWALLAAMTIVFVALLVPTVMAESGSRAVTPGEARGSNMEGKEVRFGTVNSALWAVSTTAASNGSVNAMHDSFTPIGGMIPMWLMQLGEIIYGGVGSGLYGMLLFAIVAVFIAGLMVGRTPEYLGKKIEAYEMKMASIAILVPNIIVLAFTAIAVSTGAGRAAVFNPGPHGFSEVLYAFSSMGNNNGSAFAGLGANVPLYSLLGGIAMLLSRYWVIIPVMAVAGSLARKKQVPPSDGTLPTHTPLFVALLIGTIVLVGALTHVPGLALGPIAEQLQSVQVTP